MASDFSINALLDLPREEAQILSTHNNNNNKEHGKLMSNGSDLHADLNQQRSHDEESNHCSSSSPRSNLSAGNGSTNITNSRPSSAGCLENRLPSEFTTIVQMPKKETKPRRKRTAFSNIQLYFLEQFFQKKAYPSSDERNFIASILSIGTGQVKTWFQNRRTKWKKSNYADFEKQTLVETTFHATTNPSWPICNQVLWSPGFPPAPVISNSHTSYFQ